MDNDELYENLLYVIYSSDFLTYSIRRKNGTFHSENNGLEIKLAYIIPDGQNIVEDEVYGILPIFETQDTINTVLGKHKTKEQRELRKVLENAHSINEPFLTQFYPIAPN